jgi:DNA-binding response OmpR family regulator
VQGYALFMAAQSLVLCRDPEVLGALRPLLDRLGFGTQHCPEPESAARLLLRHRYEAIIVECGPDAGGLELLRSLRLHPASRDAIAVGIVDGSRPVQDVLTSGANFVLSKPIPLEDARRILSAAKGSMSRIVRRFLRLPVGTLAYAEVEGLAERAMMLDLGEGGISVQALETLPAGRRVRVQFELPGAGIQMEARGEVCWTDASGRLGIRFLELSEADRLRVRHWVRSSLSAGWAADAAENSALGLREETLACRALAETLDGAIVLSGAALFAAVFLKLQDALPSTIWLATFGAVLVFFFWLIYRYIFFLHAVDTPGLIAARRILERSETRENAAVQNSD